uniref:Uncharacterized protein n=1 Tax=Mustela putorius furo TaxID=9669 RepID=M3XZF6_MUSPF
MTRYAVARGPGPFFFRAPPASPAPARAPPPPFPFVAAVAAAAAMSSHPSTLSLREHSSPDKAPRGGGGTRERRGRVRGAEPETAPSAAAILKEGKDTPDALRLSARFKRQCHVGSRMKHWQECGEKGTLLP